MDGQLSFATLDYVGKKKRTKGDVFLAEMTAMPWSVLEAVIAPHYPKEGPQGAFCDLELGRDSIPDETTILNFRHLLEAHELTKTVFEAVAEYLEARGALLRGGTIVDATLIAACRPPRTRRASAIRRCIPRRRAINGVCHEHRQPACGAVPKMGADLPKPACRSRLQTIRCCCVQKTWW
jgi:hypothetical protein